MPRTRRPAALLAALAALAALPAAGCRGTWESRLAPAQQAFYAGDLEAAEERLRARLEEAAPADADLLRLELAQVLQAQERWNEAAQLLMAADDRLLVLDYSDAPVDELSRVLWAPDRARWRATPPERLLLNVENMLNFLGAGAWEEAAVEARRARLLLLREEPEHRRYASPLVWGLAGVCFELAGRDGEAADAFREAGLPQLEQRPGAGEGSVLVVVQDGKAPVRVPALVYVFAYGALHRLQLPALARRPGGSARVSLSVDGRAAGELAVLLDLGEQSLRRYEQEFPRLLAAAALQVAPRAWLGEAVERELEDDDEPHDSPQNHWARFAGFMAGEFAAEVLPVDTRCWTLLPATVRVARLSLPAGTHTLAVDLHRAASEPPTRVEWTVQLDPGGFALVHLAGATTEGWSQAEVPAAQNLGTSPSGQAALELLERATMTAP